VCVCACVCVYSCDRLCGALVAQVRNELRNLGEVGGWGRVPFSRNLMSPTPRRKWYLTTGRRAH